MSLKTFSILFVFLMMSFVLCAQTVVLNSVDEAITYAYTNNIDLKTYKLNQEKALYEYKTVKYHWLPKASAGLTGQVNEKLAVTPLPGDLFGQPGQTLEAQFGQKYNYNAGISVSKTLFDVQARFTAKTAKVNQEMTQANQEIYKQKLTEQVALYYYTYIIAQKALEIQKENFQTSDSVLQLVNQKYEQGIIDQYSVNLAKMNKNNVQLTMNTYNNIINQCLSNLKILFGITSDTEIMFNENIEINKDYVYTVQEIGRDLSLKLFELQSHQANYKIKQQKAQLYPKLSFFGYYGAQQYRDDFGLSLKNEDRSDVMYWGINVSVPLFTGFSTKNKIQAAKIEYKTALETLIQEEEKSKIKDALMIKEYQNSSIIVLVAKDNYKLAKLNSDLSFLNYKQGLISLDKYFDSFNDYLKAEAAYLNALSESYNYYAVIFSRNANIKNKLKTNE